MHAVDPEPPQTTVGTKRKEPEPQTEEQQLEACVNPEAAWSEMARNHALSIEATIAEAERERDRLRDRAHFQRVLLTVSAPSVLQISRGLKTL